MLGKQRAKRPTDPSTLPYGSLHAGKQMMVTTGQYRKRVLGMFWHGGRNLVRASVNKVEKTSLMRRREKVCSGVVRREGPDKGGKAGVFRATQKLGVT